MENLTPEVAVDLIALVNSLSDIPKSGRVSYGKTFFNYALLDDILSKVKLNQNFCLMFNPYFETAEENVGFLQAVLYHKSGFKIESPSYYVNLSACKTIQEKGARLTYAKRYLLSTWLAIAADDDIDGADEKAQIEPPLPAQKKPQLPEKNIPTSAPVQQKKETSAPVQKPTEQKEELSSGGDLSEKYKRATAYTSVKYEKTLGELTLIRLMETADNQDESEQTRAAAAFLVKYIEHLQKRKSLQFHQEELGDLSFEQLEEVTKSSLEPSSIQKAAKMLLKFYGN